MVASNELGRIAEKLELRVFDYFKKASADEGSWIPLDFAELLVAEGLVKIIRDDSSTFSEDIIYGLTDSGRKLYNNLISQGYYTAKP